MVDLGILTAIGVLAIFLMFSIVIVKDDERVAVFAFGRFVKLKGPGLITRLPGGPATLVRIPLGLEGTVKSPEVVSLLDNPLPYHSDSNIRNGETVRVVGFQSDAVVVELVSREYITCENCGHKNAV